MSSKQQLKPLNHKKMTNNIEPLVKTPLSKEFIKVDNNKPVKK